MSAEEVLDILGNDNRGRGKKQCPDCKVYVGVRTYQCECGYQFVDKKTKQQKRDEEDAATDEEILYAACIGSPGGRFVYAGRGRPSIQLANLAKQTVFDYCNFVVHEGITEGLIYTPQAIKHYIMHQFEYNSGEYMSACVMVDLWYSEKMGLDIPSGVEYNE